MDGRLSPASPSPPGIYLNFRKRSVAAVSRSLENAMEEESLKASSSNESTKMEEVSTPAAATDDPPEKDPKANLSERRRALFEPLQPTANGHRTPAELLPQPDFESSSYPKGWLVGKKRKLVNVDVVESMRRIAIQEMNRKDREIGGLNQQLEEDARCMEHLQLQLLQERSRRADLERQNTLLQEQVSMLMSMLEEAEAVEEDENSIDP